MCHTSTNAIELTYAELYNSYWATFLPQNHDVDIISISSDSDSDNDSETEVNFDIENQFERPNDYRNFSDSPPMLNDVMWGWDTDDDDIAQNGIVLFRVQTGDEENVIESFAVAENNELLNDDEADWLYSQIQDFDEILDGVASGRIPATQRNLPDPQPDALFEEMFNPDECEVIVISDDDE